MINIERTTETGYLQKEYEKDEALQVLNTELENDRTIWIDGKLFSGEIITSDDLDTCKKGICVTNKLIGG
jgi:hypothetical protein